MKIKQLNSEHGADFTAIMVCEHCGHEQENKGGYHDRYYHVSVIPEMLCKSCGKNRAGEFGLKR